jgi:hypothetical protein
VIKSESSHGTPAGAGEDPALKSALDKLGRAIEEQGGLEAYVNAWETSQVERVRWFVEAAARIDFLVPVGAASSDESSDPWLAFVVKRLQAAQQNGRLEEELEILAFDYENYEDYQDEDERAEVERRLELLDEKITHLVESVESSPSRKPSDLVLALRTIIDP